MKQIAIALIAITLSMTYPAALLAVDCALLIKNIDSERNFLKRKEMVEEAAQQCPDNAVLVFKYGFSLERFNQPEEALKYYKKAAQLNSNMAKAYFGQGDIYQFLNRYKEAVEAYRKGLEIDPTNVRAIRCRIKAEESLKAAQ